jgi:hypothetical protein
MDSPDGALYADGANAAIAQFREHLRQYPTDGGAMYRLASCLAYRGRFDEADELFARNIAIGTGNGGLTNTKIIRLAPAHHTGDPSHPRRPSDGDGKAPPGLSSHIDTNFEVPHLMEQAELVYFIACDPVYAKLFVPAVLRSLEQNVRISVGLHLHLINPDGDCFSLVRELIGGSALPIVLSHETLRTSGVSAAAVKTYCAISRLLVLPEILQRYGKTVLMADADQLVLKDLSELVRLAAGYDAGLLFQPDEIANLLSLLSATAAFIQPTEQGQAFAERMRRYVLDRMACLQTELFWHLDQAALAVSALRTPRLRWFPIPPATLQSDMYGANPDNQIRSETVFWSITFSHSESRKKLSSATFQRYRNGAPARYRPPALR